MNMRAVIYTRISQADEKVDKPQDQADAMRKVASDSGYTVVAVLTDDDISAFEGKYDRPAFNELLARTAQGEFDVVMATEPQRFTRGDPVALEALNVALTKSGAVYHTRAAGVQDPATPMVKGILQLQDTLAWIEVAIARDRQRNRNAADRARGIPKRALRPFGYEVDGMTVRESEASFIRGAVEDYLSGTRSFTQIAHDWNAAGLQTDGMKRERKGRDGIKKAAQAYWKPSQVRNVLLRPRNAGILTHQGEELPESQIQPIITRTAHEELVARRMIPTGKKGAKATSLLGGIIRCECGKPMHHTVSYSQRKGGPRRKYFVYKCAETAFDRTRRHASIQTHLADDLLVGMLLLRLYNGDLEAENDDQSARLMTIASERAERAEEKAHLSSIILDYTAKSLHAQARARLSAVEESLVSLAAEAESIAAQSGTGGLLGAFIEEWRDAPEGFRDNAELEDWNARFDEVWTSRPIEWKRAILHGAFRPLVRVGGRGVGRIYFD